MTKQKVQSNTLLQWEFYATGKKDGGAGGKEFTTHNIHHLTSETTKWMQQRGSITSTNSQSKKETIISPKPQWTKVP